MWSRGTGVAVRFEMGVSMSAKGSKHKDYEVRIKLEYSDSRFQCPHDNWEENWMGFC